MSNHMLSTLRCGFSLFVLGFTFLTACGTTQRENSKYEAHPIRNSWYSEFETRIRDLVKKLNDNKPQVREDATDELVEIGKPAETYLQETLKQVKGKNAE